MREGKRSVRNRSMSIVSGTSVVANVVLNSRSRDRDYVEIRRKGVRLSTCYRVLLSFSQFWFRSSRLGKSKRENEIDSSNARNICPREKTISSRGVLVGFRDDSSFLETERRRRGEKKRRNSWTMNLRRRRAIGRGYALSG